MTIYVPDDLWERAVAVGDASNTSAFVQAALSDYVDRKARDAINSPPKPAGSDEAVEALRQRLAREARERFEEGYVVALQDAQQLPWPRLEDLAEAEFDLAAWLRPALRRIDRLHEEDKAPDPEVSWAIDVHVHVGPIRVARVPTGDLTFVPGGPGRSYLRGYTQALRDVWEAVEHGPKSEEEGDSAVRDVDPDDIPF